MVQLSQLLSFYDNLASNQKAHPINGLAAGSEAEAKLSAERELDPARSPPSQLQKDQSERTQATEETGPYQRTGKTKADTPQPRFLPDLVKRLDAS